MEDRLFDYFSGKLVDIIMKSVKGEQKHSDGRISKGNIVMSGYLLDQDIKFYYIGSTNEDITEALDKNEVIRINIADDEAMFDFSTEGDMQ